jgi:hypothetical protein
MFGEGLIELADVGLRGFRCAAERPVGPKAAGSIAMDGRCRYISDVRDCACTCNLGLNGPPKTRKNPGYESPCKWFAWETTPLRV